MADFLSPIPSNQLLIKEEDANHNNNKKLILLEQQQQQQTPSSTATSSSSSSARRPRGRPPGSKNKPKPPIIITQQAHSSMQQVFLQISPASDVVNSVLDFARRRRVGVSILSASGAVVNVGLRHPAVPGSTISLSGRFEILSLSGFFLPAAAEGEWESCKVAGPFGITLAGAQGQVIGGTLASGLMAAGTVAVTAATFVGPEFYRLPLIDEEVQAQQHEEDAKNEMVLWGSPPAAVPRAPPPHLHRSPSVQPY